jgi:hypothetical protein
MGGGKNLITGATELEDLKVLDKFKGVYQDGRKRSVSIANGEIMVDGNIGNDSYDFVITSQGELRLGEGHYFLSDMADEVKGAGIINITNGKIDYIDNNSGHYVPTIKQTYAILQVLGGKNGLAVPPQNMMVVDITK